MDGDVENVTAPFDEGGDSALDSDRDTDGALALADMAGSNTAAEAARLADYAQAWGITVPADFTPVTKATVAYWRELCGAISLTGADGMRDGDWPADLAPSRPTLSAMTDRALVVRRRRAWHLKRKWHAWLQYLRLTAVPTPALMIADRPAPGLPTYAELQVWEAVCRWIDGQPQRRTRLPMVDIPDVGEVPGETLLARRKVRLVRHCSGCSWALSPRWKAILLALWHGVIKAEGERDSRDANDVVPFSVAAGIDTWYLNRLDLVGLTPELRRQLEDLQELARHNDEEVETPWRCDGTPLLMYQAGVNTSQSGGVSWSYIVRNASLTLLIRKIPLGSVIAQARLGSECLWRLTPRRALDELDAMVRRMWWGSLRHPRKKQGKWQVSQVHLAHNIAITNVALEQLDRYASRSRHQSVFEPAQAELHSLYAVVDGHHNADGVDLVDPLLDLAWENAFTPEEDEVLDPFLDGADNPAFGEGASADMVAVGERSTQVYRWGTRLSGVTWSPGGAISFVQYDKTLESRLRNKRYMEPIWRAAGWDGKTLVIRHEARLRRDALRTFGLPTDVQSSLDDPWIFLTHLSEVWGYVVGQAPHTDDGSANCAATASLVDVAWLRRVVPDANTNRSRWLTDPPTKVRRLMRREQHVYAVEQLDAGAYGYLVSRTALLHPKGETFDVSMGLRGLFDALTKIAAQPDKDFGELVRQRRRTRGLPVAPVAKVLPFLPAWSNDHGAEGAALDRAGEVLFGGESPADELRAARVQLAEGRMREALHALDEAGMHGSPAHEVARLELVYAHDRAAYEQLMATKW
jgi:hypothetical protein